MKVLVLFPGYGSPYKAVLRKVRSLPETKRFLRKVDKIFISIYGESLSKYMLEERPITQPEIMQSVIVVCDLLYLRLACKSNGFSPILFLGHSFGEYAALVASKVISLEDALTITVASGKMLHSIDGIGSMLSIKSEIDEANFSYLDTQLQKLTSWGLSIKNNESFYMGSGLNSDRKKAMEICSVLGFSTRDLKIGYPFHSEYMKSAIAPLKSVLSNIRFSKPVIPYISSIDGRVYSKTSFSESTVRRNLFNQLRLKMNFYSYSIIGLQTIKDSSEIVLECGPRNMLSTLFKETVLKSNKTISVYCMDKKNRKFREKPYLVC